MKHLILKKEIKSKKAINWVLTMLTKYRLLLQDTEGKKVERQKGEDGLEAGERFPMGPLKADELSG